ncbi:helix-turn-helix transcriptional regulator [Roseovarius sp. THAF9]|uniref:helix-turn-helix domain-containing protein n=1 Tax=Roseovarius sp. THAF9 TaxID=2587847 RepID=UPI0012679539|nr:helix-turn-helix transcriptional regulator [Roseovarius sp. THAF9]
MSKTISSQSQTVLCLELVEARKRAGLLQSDLAEKLDCHQSLIARIESGQRRIDVIEFLILTRAIQANPEELLAKVAAHIGDRDRL